MRSTECPCSLSLFSFVKYYYFQLVVKSCRSRNRLNVKESRFYFDVVLTSFWKPTFFGAG